LINSDVVYVITNGRGYQSIRTWSAYLLKNFW
jgi:hypothetical protein